MAHDYRERTNTDSKRSLCEHGLARVPYSEISYNTTTPRERAAWQPVTCHSYVVKEGGRRDDHSELSTFPRIESNCVPISFILVISWKAPWAADEVNLDSREPTGRFLSQHARLQRPGGTRRVDSTCTGHRRFGSDADHQGKEQGHVGRGPHGNIPTQGLSNAALW